MDLELRNVQVKDVVLGDKNDLKDGVLTVDVEGLKKLILEDPRVTAVKVDLAKPGESCRILPVKDVVEPRYKPEGEIFPGVFGSDVPEAGSGVTYVLKGCAVVTTGPIVGFQEGLIDMSGPAAQYTLFSKLNNVVLHLTKREDVDQHEHEEVVRMAGLKAARWLGEVAVKAESYDSEFYHWPTAAQRANQYPDRPRWCMCATAWHRACCTILTSTAGIPSSWYPPSSLPRNSSTVPSSAATACPPAPRPRPITT